MSGALLVSRTGGLLGAFHAAGVLDAADVHVARRLGALAREESEPVLLAAAMVVRAVRLGAVCVELDHLHDVQVEDVDVPALPWPDSDALLTALRRSPLVAGAVLGDLRPLHLVEGSHWPGDAGGPLLYLDRYHRQEQSIRGVLDERLSRRPPYDLELLSTGLDRYDLHGRQRVAAAMAVTRWTSIVAGGPGTGKTTTVAGILQLLLAQQEDLRIALTAPTGRAAARLQDEVNGRGVAATATTLHRLLGWRPQSRTRFRHDATNRLPHDVVVVDETSMVSLTMMARLLEALRPDARLVLLGDPDQLASVDAGAVLADLVHRPPPDALPGDADVPLTGPALADDGADGADGQDLDLTPAEVSALAGGVVQLRRVHRFGVAIAALAAAVRDGRADAAMDVLHSGSPEVSLVSPDDTDGLRSDLVACARAVTDAATQGRAGAALTALQQHRLLCAHRAGHYGVEDWDLRVQEWVGTEASRPAAAGRPAPVERLAATTGWYPGQPLLVTANDPEANVYNGDVGVVVRVADGTLRAAFGRGDTQDLRRPGLLASVRTAYALTIHRSQGSQYRHVSVLLPPATSVLLTRQLLYTAITRAELHVRVLADEVTLRAAIERRVPRASGLRRPSAPVGLVPGS